MTVQYVDKRGQTPANHDAHDWRFIALLAMFFALLAIVFSASARAQQQDFLDPEKAFVLNAQMAAPDTIQLKFKIANGYYMYREQFAFKIDTEIVKLGEAKFPVGQI